MFGADFVGATTKNNFCGDFWLTLRTRTRPWPAGLVLPTSAWVWTTFWVKFPASRTSKTPTPASEASATSAAVYGAS